MLLGGAGSDNLYGRAGRDLIIGGDDNDLLMGSTGADLLLGADVDAAFAADDVALLELLELFRTSPAAARDELEGHASDDGNPDTLHGEADGDWYLVYFDDGDILKLASELKSPNNVRNLT